MLVMYDESEELLHGAKNALECEKLFVAAENALDGEAFRVELFPQVLEAQQVRSEATVKCNLGCK